MTETPVYERLYRAVGQTDRFVSSCGGTRSGKTFAALQLIYKLAVADTEPTITSVVSETFPHLKRGAIRDFQVVLGDLWDESCWSRGEYIYRLPNGSIIEFFSADSPSKVHGPARDRLFLNEVQSIPYEIARQLFVRTRGLVLLDYNPTHSFWANEQIETRPNCVTIHSTYKDNPFLTTEQVAEIEANQQDRNWWKVYGEGRVGTLEGVIYEFEQIDAMPAPGGLVETYGVDFGFTCFDGDTLITTDKGEKPIREILPGDKVLTRRGFRSVIEKKVNGYKEVTEKIIKFTNGDSIRIAATNNHFFNVNGKWKKYGKLEKGDKLFIVSPLTARSIGDTRQGNTQTIISTNGNRMGSIIQNYFIMPFGRKNTARPSPKGMSSTTKISTRLITNPITCNLSRRKNTTKSTAFYINSMQGTRNIINKSHIARITGTSAERLRLKGYNPPRVFANNAGRSLLRQMSTSDSVPNHVIINGNIQAPIWRLISFAKSAGKRFAGINTSNQKLAQSTAPMYCRVISDITEVCRRGTDVFDLWVDGVHEYFANGILVHNCDPTAIVRVLADTGRKTAYIEEICYNTGMMNADIAEALNSRQIARNVHIWADAAEPKSIAEIGHASGLNIRACDKSAPVRSERLKWQLQWMQGWRLMVTKSSLNLIKELRNYTWAKDRDGNVTDTPIDTWNHAADAMRYALFSEIAGREGSGQYNISFNRPRR